MKCVYLSYEKSTAKKGDDVLDETTTLAVPIQGITHGVGLVEVSGRVVTSNARSKENMYICCDICEDSNVEDIKMPVLRQLKRNANGVLTTDIHHIIWLRTNRPEISDIRMYIADSKGQLVSLSSYRLSCLLLFVPA